MSNVWTYNFANCVFQINSCKIIVHMVDTNLQRIKHFLLELGLNPEESLIYLTLNQHGPLTPLEISRKTRISRTTVYRLLDEMRSEKLITEIIDQHRTLAQAITPEELRLKLTGEQDRLSRLVYQFPQVQNYLDQQVSRRHPDTQVKFYRGRSGIEQMLFNVLNANNNIYGFSPTDFSKTVSRKTYQYVYQEIVAQKLIVQDIYSDRYIQSIGGLDHLKSGSSVYQKFPNHFISRYLPSSTLDVTTQMDIYNDIIAIYNWTKEDIFGVEIHNAKVSKMQQQIFKILWDLAIPEAELLKNHPTITSTS